MPRPSIERIDACALTLRLLCTIRSCSRPFVLSLANLLDGSGATVEDGRSEKSMPAARGTRVCTDLRGDACRSKDACGANEEGRGANEEGWGANEEGWGARGAWGAARRTGLRAGPQENHQGCENCHASAQARAAAAHLLEVTTGEEGGVREGGEGGEGGSAGHAAGSVR